MATAAATIYAPTPDPSQHEEVDFMTMFTNQNDDASVKGENPEVGKPVPTEAHAADSVHAPTLPAVDPLQVFDAPAPHAAASWTPHHPVQAYPMHMPPGAMAPVAAYPQHVMYHPHPPLGPPFMPGQVAPMPHYVEPSALPGAMNQPTFSAFTAPAAAAVPSPEADAKPMVSTPPSTTVASAVTTPPATTATAASSSPSAGSSSNSPPTATPATTAAGRRKRKLTPEDKRKICEIYRNSQGKIRQEDIAKEYSVDRSTISKILNQEERWLDPEQSGGASGMSRRPGGRYPAIEEDIHRWLDEAVLAGREVRDSEAREQALKIGLRLGHPHFQASSKWWDGVKRRRLEEGRPMPTARRAAAVPRATAPVMPGLVRTYTMDIPSQTFPMAGPSGYALMDHGIMAAGAPGAIMPSMPHQMRARSQSSPQMFNGYMAAQQAPSSGPTRQRMSPPRHSPVTPLGRNRSYHGSSASSSPVGRPSPLHRVNSSHGRPSPHVRLAASAFGLTPMDQQQGVHTPTEPSALQMQQHHTGTTTPTASASASMPSLSPLSVSDSSDSQLPNAALSPSTPCTPAQPTFIAPGQPEYMDLNGCTPQPPVAAYHTHMMVGGYAGAPFSAPPLYPGYEYVQGQW